MTTAASKGPAQGNGKAVKKAPAQPGATFDFWDGELAPEGHHPLASPLPNSIWEKYAKHRELLGKDPMKPEHYNEAEKRGEAKEAGDSDPFPGSRMDAIKQQKKSVRKTAHESPAPEKMPADALVDHMVKEHNWTPENAQAHADFGHSNLIQQHQADHDSDAEYYNELSHTHAKPKGEIENPLGHEEVKQHLQDHHGVAGWELDLAGDDPEELQSQHEHMHSSTSENPDHSHPEGVAMKEKVAEEPSHAGPEQLKHPSKFTNGSLHAHLLEDHGIDPDHMANAIDGTYESTDASHVVHLLHNQAHQSGQVVNEHEHENWDGGPKVSPVHKDVGKPFWGATPNNPTKHLNHLTDQPEFGGHGIHPDDVPSTYGMSDTEAQDVMEKFHDAHHVDHADSLLHQHVPTVQPGVMSPKKAKKKAIADHLAEFHGIADSFHPEMEHSGLHDESAYAYKGHPGHEHHWADPHGAITQTLPQVAPTKNAPLHVDHVPHAGTMAKDELTQHLQTHHSNEDDVLSGFSDYQGKSHEELLQQHALKHASGDMAEHTHAALGPTDPLQQDPHYGHEPEIQTDTHPAIESESQALAHIVKHHPEVSQEAYKSWSGPDVGKPTMQSFHDALHSKESNGLPKALDGHDHAEPNGAPTQISVGSHLVHDHGMSQEDVASMTPAEFKAHHEKLHLKEPEFDLGHGHDYPGGPVRDPRMHLPNTHHAKMRADDRHPAVNEWYHGTGAEYEGAPKNATELQEDHGFWGNWGGGDWNNHVGTHWTSLHTMAASFSGKNNSGRNRVIHAKLHISNPVTYNSLNHMAHDAYDRLRASGHLQDDGRWEGNHDDASGYNKCCSDTLLEYAKGHHRSDGKFGLEAFRDSLRASGYDGIHVRNQADEPKGHWNAIPLSADQVEITHGGCRGTHGDGRDDDTREFEQNPGKTKSGWQHPKAFKPSDYHGSRLDHLPDEGEVAEANVAKGERKPRFKEAEGRGDSDPYLRGREFGEGGADEEDEEEPQWCDHCDEDTDHSSEDCQTSKWCDVCEEHGDHEKGDDNSPHDYCSHCDDYADHETDDHEDEYGEKPDEYRKEAYCPHCDESHKGNYNSSDCVNCGEKLPDWGKLQAFGTPVKKGQYARDGDSDSVAYGHASEAKLHPNDKDGAELAAHLYHHHKSDVGGKEFDNNGEWDEDALDYHHQWLHQNPAEAKGQGFEVDHDHKHMFGQFKKTEKMSPHEVHAHLMLSHAGTNAGSAGMGLDSIIAMTPEEAVEKHKQLHDADDATKWGEKSVHGGLQPKANHTHNLDGDQASFDEEFHPQGEHLLAHLADKKSHMGAVPQVVHNFLQDNPETAKALHQQMHQNYGPSSEPGIGKFHVHTPEMVQDLENHSKIKSHLVNDHGADPDHFQIKNSNTDDLMTLHHQEHTSQFPNFNDPDHTHIGGTSHKVPEKHTAETMKKPEPEGEKKEFIPLSSTEHMDKNGIIGHILDHHKDTHPELHAQAEEVFDEPPYGVPGPQLDSQAKALHAAHAEVHGPLAEGHPDHYHFDHETKTKTPPKTAALRTLTNLFEEVAL